MMRLSSIVFLGSSLVLAGCAASEGTVADGETPGSGASGGSSGSGASGGSAGSAGNGGSGGGWSTGGGSGSGGTTGSGGSGGGWGTGGSSGSGGGAIFGDETLCDGLDNDQDGIIDDVDKGQDGICDCLKIATLGVKGKYGQGDVFANWLTSRSDFGAVSIGLQDLSSAMLEPFDVIVAQDVSAKGGVFGGLGGKGYSAAEASALYAWIQAGGGLMTLIGYEDEYSINNINTLLGPTGMSYGSQQILQNSGSTVPVTNWITHQLTGGVSLLGVGNGYPVTGPGTMLANEQGHNVLQTHDIGSGRVVMWADEWITYDSEWQSNPQYQVELFWLNVIKWLTPADICQVPIPPSIK